MNTTLTEHTTDEIEELRKDYYDEYYPSPRIEKAIFNYLDQDYYASEDDVFYTIYKKENDWFVNREDLQKEIENMFGLTLPERLKVGPNEDDYIEPARNPIPGRVIHKWIVKHQLGNFGEKEEDKEIAEDLENWGFDGKEIGPLKEQTTNNKLINKFLIDFWPQYRNQLYRALYNTYHPSGYVESFNRPSSQFEDALEIVGDAVNEGKKLGLLDSSVHWSDMYHYDDDSITKLGDTGEMPPKRYEDDDGIPTLRDQLEIMDDTNLDWIHGILLFDVLEDIVDEFKSYCGENGIDESGMGKCIDDFPPSPNHEQINRTGGTLKQDYYTLFNFMKELERAGVPVVEYMKSPIFPNIIKLVDDNTTDYDTTGKYSPMRQDPEAMDVPDRLYEQDISDSELNDDEIKNLETQIEIDKETIKNLEKDLKDAGKKEYKAFGKTKRFGYEDDDDKGAVIGIGRDASAFNETELVEQNPENSENSGGEQESNWPEWDPNFELDDTTKDLETTIKKTNIEIKKGDLERKEKQLKVLQAKGLENKNKQSASSMGGDSKTPMGGEKVTDGTKPISIKKIVSVTEHEEAEESFDDSGEPFTKKEVVILKTLHKNLTKEELYKISDETPQAYGTTDNKFWSVMKLFGIEETHTEQNTRESRYAKWAYDNWTEDGDYGSIEEPIKAPLKWYHVDRDESGSQIEYKSGDAEVLGFDEDDAGERADYDFYAWGGEMETMDYGDYEHYDSEITDSQFLRMDEQVDQELKYTIDQEYRTDPEMRDALLQSLGDESDELTTFSISLEDNTPVLDVPPIKIAQKFSDANGYGSIKFDMQGGNGIAYFTDKNLVIKLTADDSEYFTANKLLGTDNEYIVKVIESAKIKTSHSNAPIFVIVEEALPMTEEMENIWSECCCGVNSPIHIDYLEEPALVLPPVSLQDKCLPIYDNIIGIQKNFAEYGITWSDIGIDNMGIKNGKLAVVDLGETRGQGSVEGKTLTLEHINIRPLTSKQIKKQLVLI